MAQHKLYTKLQVSEAITLARLTDDSTSDIFKQLTPIELPSDEEINNDAKSYHEKNKLKSDYPHCPYSFKDGAKWLRDKLLNQNK